MSVVPVLQEIGELEAKNIETTVSHTDSWPPPLPFNFRSGHWVMWWIFPLWKCILQRANFTSSPSLSHVSQRRVSWPTSPHEAASGRSIHFYPLSLLPDIRRGKKYPISLDGEGGVKRSHPHWEPSLNEICSKPFRALYKFKANCTNLRLIFCPTQLTFASPMRKCNS